MPVERKFTEEVIAEIRRLVGEGRSREEVAGLVGTSVGSLSVTCSRLGISLRRQRVRVICPVCGK